MTNRLVDNHIDAGAHWQVMKYEEELLNEVIAEGLPVDLLADAVRLRNYFLGRQRQIEQDNI